MSIFDTIPNSATTLSINYRPGQNKRLMASKSEAIFTFGDFTLEKNYSLNYLTADIRHAQFGGFDNLSTLNAASFSNTIATQFVEQNELNLPKKNPKSHSYFSSFYTNVASSINKIISDFPYAILSYNNGDVNIFDYTESYNGITFERTSSFKIPISGLTNQGNIALASANTENNFSLPYDYSKFCIQISGQTDTFKIKNYSLSGTYLYFEIYNFLKSNNEPTYTDAIYIKPTNERIYNYNKSISSLEKQLLNDGVFLVPAVNSPKNESFEQTFIWPKTIDGYAPNSYGEEFETYRDSILAAAEKIDDEKTNIFIKTITPENYLELDSEGQIYRTIIQTYAHEFDVLKGYIDAIAYAHSIDYNDEETVPKKFLIKLSGLLGWKLAEGFSELDLFDYLTSDLDQQTNSFSYFNVEIWKRILVNLVWLYKKKGTRDAIMFIFKLLGAPDCLINFNEFVYDITKTAPSTTEKVDVDGYINYQSSKYAFQAGGVGRGNGHDYINQWSPEFSPISRVDNNKVQTGSTSEGTRSIVNSKEIQLAFSPAQAIEHDVWEFFQEDGSCWSWGSSLPPFSSLTTPYEYLTFSCNVVAPTNIADMTLTQYIDYLYTNSIDPTTRKTDGQCHTSWEYPELRNIYMSYYLSTNPKSNRLTMCKLEAYMQLLEAQLGDYILQLVPATTIFDDTVPTAYKNTVFHRQRFIYKEGVDSGSMFKKNFPDEIIPVIPYCSLGKGQIHIFAGQSKLPNRLIDESGTTWRLERNISSSNIHPSAKNRMCKINLQKNEKIICDIKEMLIGMNYQSTNKTTVGSFKITCSVNANLVSSTLASLATTGEIISETSENLINEKLLTF